MLTFQTFILVSSFNSTVMPTGAFLVKSASSFDVSGKVWCTNDLSTLVIRFCPGPAMIDILIGRC